MDGGNEATDRRKTTQTSVSLASLLIQNTSNTSIACSWSFLLEAKYAVSECNKSRYVEIRTGGLKS